jgi:prepilin-type processing-associated H-X9-DG protein
MAGKMTNSASGAKCISNLRQIAAALNVYAAEHNNHYPAVRRLNPSVYWYMDLAKYVEGNINIDTQIGDSLDIAPVFRCPAAVKDFKAPNEKLVYRTYMASDFMRARDSNGVKSWQVGVNLATIEKPASSIVCIDGARAGADFTCQSANSWPAAAPLISYRHRGYANALFFDGHVAPVKPGEVGAKMWNSP